MKIAKIILSALLTLLIMEGLAGVAAYIHIRESLPDVSTLKTVELQQTMQILPMTTL